MTLALLGPIGAFVGVAPTASAGPCDQVGGVITGDWTINNVQTCTGILYTVDGSVTINGGGSLTLVNGGLRFAKDSAHTGYSLTVNAGGELILDNSVVTTQTEAIGPYLRLALTVSGRLTMRNEAMLKFPGWFNATGATIDLTDSTITGFTSAELNGLGVYQDDNDDSPVINWATTSAGLFRSRIERIYENASASGGTNVTGIVMGNVTLRAGANLYAYDSYIGADYSNVVGLHNEVQVDGTSNAYLYGVEIDRVQDPLQMSAWQTPFVPLAAGGAIYLHRWLHVTALDSTAFPVSGATIWSTLSPSSTTAQFPDNGLATTPSARTLAYLGRTATGLTAWNRTDATGTAILPLYTDQITTATLPNAESFGNYRQVLTFSTSTTTTGVDFDPFPAIDDVTNNEYVTTTFSGLVVRTTADLALAQADYPGTLPVNQGQPFTVYALIYNQGQTDATDVSIAAYVGGTPVARVDGLTVPASPTPVNTSLYIASGVATLGTQLLMLWVDPDNTIDEGGAAQENNNFANITLDVQSPLNGFVAILTPDQNQIVEPGTPLSVTGYVRDQFSVGILGVPVTAELRSATGGLVGSNLTSSAGLGGYFSGTINIPSTTPDGTYTLTVTAAGQISPDSRTITIRRTGSFLFSTVPFLGLPVWLLLVILVAAVAMVLGVTLYFRVYGLGKMVECGECGSFISEDSRVCPKCGVEFEKDMAKCSNCQAWIPVDVKQCPECGVEFATGKVEMADYQEKMRMQYDEVVAKFRREASAQLGRALGDAEFQDWWRTQPTFVTFEDWLREEEEMRKMGSRPCIACGTLNSVTATVCHKCGTYLKAERRPTTVTPVRRPGLGVEAREAPQPGPPGPVPAKVVRRPGPPVPAQKKPVRKPGEGEGSEEQAASDDTGVDDL